MNMTPDNPQNSKPSDEQSASPSDQQDVGPGPHSADASESHAVTVSETTEVHIRRAPKYANIMVFGAVLGLIIAFIFAVVFDDPEVTDTTWQQAFGFLFLPTVGISIAVFGIVALLLDRRSKKRERVIAAERIQHIEQPAPQPVTKLGPAHDGGSTSGSETRSNTGSNIGNENGQDSSETASHDTTEG